MQGPAPKKDRVYYLVFRATGSRRMFKAMGHLTSSLGGREQAKRATGYNIEVYDLDLVSSTPVEQHYNPDTLAVELDKRFKGQDVESSAP